MSETFWTALMASIPAALTALGGLIVTLRTSSTSQKQKVEIAQKIDDVHEGINGQLAAWKKEVIANLEQRVAAALAEGIVKGEENERERSKIRAEDRIREANATTKK